MRRLLSIALSVLSCSSFAQYTWMQSKITCDTAQKKMVTEATDKFKPILDDLVKEGKILNWALDENKKKGKIVLSYTVTLADDKKFTAAMDDYFKRAAQKHPELYQTYLKACPTRKDTVNLRNIVYPTVRGSIWSGVVDLANIDEKPDPKMDYNIVMDFTAFPATENDKVDSVNVNWGLSDIGRLYNLHVAAGVPKEKIHMVAAVHAFAQFSFLNNDAYRKKYKTDNPNLPLIKELSDAGVKFLVCGQSMTYMKVDKAALVPEAKVTLTAQTTLTSYQLKGYALKDMGN